MPESPLTGETHPSRTPPVAAAREAAEASADGASASERALKIFGSVVAPAAALTALMFFFGLLHAYWFFGRFGVDYTVMGLTSQDFLVRSADGLFVPLTLVGAVGLAVLWSWRLLPARVAVRSRAVAERATAPLGAVVGLALLLVALVGIVEPARLEGLLGAPGLALATGVLVLAGASRLGSDRRRARDGAAARPPTPLPLAVAEWAAIFLLVSVGLFWAVADYSAAVGTRRGNEVVAALPAWPDAVLYSERSLNLALPGVREQRCAEPEGAFAFRYDGLKLIVQSGNQMLFLPERWVDDGGAALVIPRTDALRLEFSAPGTARDAAC